MPTKQFSVSTAQVELVEYNDKRTALAIHNSHATGIAYISDEGSVSSGSGFHIQGKTTLALSEIEGIDVRKRWVIIASEAITVSVLEGFAVEPIKPKPDIQDPKNFYDPPA